MKTGYDFNDITTTFCSSFWPTKHGNFIVATTVHPKHIQPELMHIKQISHREMEGVNFAENRM
jgi:hypothetical protein